MSNRDLTQPLLDSKVILKYVSIHLAELVLLVIALLLLRYFLGISAWLVATIVVLWVIKDTVLFFKVWRSYAFDDNSPMRKLMGLEATAVYSLEPAGYVRVKGELWRAEVRDERHPVQRGERAIVVGMREMTLIVEGCPSLSANAATASETRE
jgi:membrane-bound ClpP family serine protease